MARFLLIHGSCHGAWCWRDTIPALEAQGHDARAIDLPSHGQDPTPAEQVTLDAYAEAILNALEPETILVGHSAGGYAITRAADLDRGRVAGLVYLAAYVPWPGQSLAEMRRRAPRQPLIAAVEKAADGMTFTIRPEAARGVFYHDCDDATARWATGQLGPQPVRPQETRLPHVGRAARLPRSYILCAEDGAVPAEFQREMAADFAPGNVYEMPGGHSPFLADPAGLAQRLHEISKGVRP